MRRIETPDAPRPAGPYAQAVVHNGLCHVSGQLPLDPATGTFVEGDIEAQTRRTLDNLLAVVRAAGGGPETVLKVTVYLADMALGARFNAVYAEVFGAYPPARSLVPCLPLRPGMLVEIDAMAAVPGEDGASA